MRKSLPAMVHVASPWHTDLTKRKTTAKKRFHRALAFAPADTSSTDSLASVSLPQAQSGAAESEKGAAQEETTVVML